MGKFFEYFMLFFTFDMTNSYGVESIYEMPVNFLKQNIFKNIANFTTTFFLITAGESPRVSAKRISVWAVR